MRCAHRTNPDFSSAQPHITVQARVECQVRSCPHLCQLTTVRVVFIVQQTLILVLIASFKQITRWMTPNENANEKKLLHG